MTIPLRRDLWSTSFEERSYGPLGLILHNFSSHTKLRNYTPDF